MSEGTPERRKVEPRTLGLFAVGMLLVLLLLAVAGNNGAVYAVCLLLVPIGSGVLAGLGLIRFWHAVAACLAVVALDIAFDETRADDLGFFAVLLVVMVGIAALARLVARWVSRRRSIGADQ